MVAAPNYKDHRQRIEQSQAITTRVTATPPDTAIGERVVTVEITCKRQLAEVKQIPTAQKIKTKTALVFEGLSSASRLDLYYLRVEHC